MKQILICKKEGVYNKTADGFDATSVGDGNIAFVNNRTGDILTTTATNNFSIVLGRPASKQPIIIPEVDINTLSVAVARYTPGQTFSADFTIPTPIVGYTYTAIFAKKGVVLNERNKWTATVVANSTDPVNIAEEIVSQINASSETSGLLARAEGAKIVVTNSEEDYNVILADELTGVAVNIVNAKPKVLDAKWVKDLASKCAAGKGFNYLSEDGKDMYPGYPEELDSKVYDMVTLRFAVPRAASKTRDEVVYQSVHIVVPNKTVSTASGEAQNNVIQDILNVVGTFATVLPED